MIDIPEFQEIKLILDKEIDELSDTGQKALALIGLLANQPFKKNVIADVMEIKSPITTANILRELVDLRLLLYHENDDLYQLGHSLIYTYAQGRADLYGRRYKTQIVNKLIEHFFTVLQNVSKNTLPDDEEAHILITLQRVKERYEDDPAAYKQMIDFVNLLDPFLEAKNENVKRVKWLEEAYYCAEKMEDRLAQADFATRMGHALGWLGQLDKALDWMAKVEIALKGNRTSSARQIRARMYIQRSSLYFMKRDVGTAEKDCLRGLKLSVTADQRNFAEGCNLLGVIQSIKGNISQALPWFEQSRKNWEALKNEYEMARVDDNISIAHFYLGNIAQSCAAGKASLQYWQSDQRRIEFAMALTNLGIDYQCQEKYQKAFKLHKDAITISDRIGVQRIRALTRVNIAWPCIALKEFSQAGAYITESLQIQQEFNVKENWVEAHRAQAEIALGRKLGAQAFDLAQKALDLAREDENPLEEGAALRVLGQACHLTGDLAQARQHLETSFSLLRENYKYESFLTLQALAGLYNETGEPEKAQAAAENAQTLAKEMGLRPAE